MKPEQVIGAIGMATMTIRPGDTSVAQGVNDLPVVGSNQLLSLMESACNSAVAEFLDQGESTILQRIALEINESVGIGTEIQGSATCTNLEDNLILFVCEIHDGSRLIAFATMERLVIDRVSYLARSAAYSLISQQSDS